MSLQLKELNEFLRDHLFDKSGKVRKSHPVWKYGDKTMTAFDLLRRKLEELHTLSIRQQNPQPKSSTAKAAH
jgi:hypothetical protein